MTNSRVTDGVVLSSHSFPRARNSTRTSFLYQKVADTRFIKSKETLNYKNSRITNFNSIRKLIMDNERERRDEEEEEEESGEAINLSFSSIRRTVFYEIISQNEIKTCTPV